MWVPSHRGITGNEKADKAAREAINSIDVTDSLLVLFTDYFLNIKENIYTLWTELWKKDQENKGKWYGSIQDNLPVKPWYDKLKTSESRDFITTINRLRFGHNTAPSHLARLGIVSNSQCIHCQAEEGTIHHIIFDCQSFIIQRLVLASELSDTNAFKCVSSSRPPPLNFLLKDPTSYKPIYNYIKNTIQTI
ncbi:uncharacterized protein LOC114252439 isoform X2 [Bombyx mandarina]|uniref:Uncharacterized protein LOC114252439 isoform X1 n=1 Tax=Bombyx mandarina TaxID=7092 RepID=A0A6J2KK51_BOMMA|nr:uncharacterized protein LOC114252439 isoform X1 [Bombyx mandarina]XP_028042716.1 uncharacterized protein LOC114252439 isoform X2 [Bombyx mandarina]